MHSRERNSMEPRAWRWLPFALIVIMALVYFTIAHGDDEGRSSRGRHAAERNSTPLAVPPPARDRAAGDRDSGVEASEARAAQLPFPRPSRFRPRSAERALAAFMSAWRDRHWIRMTTWAALSWRGLVLSPPRTLRKLFGPQKLRGYAILNERLLSSVAKIDLLLEYRELAPQLRRRRVTAEIRRERRIAGGVTLVASDGRWGIDPASLKPGQGAEH
jgi:hypothetical protein